MSAIAAPRRRVRAPVMAEELGISIRKFREIQTLGMPFTQVEGVLWFEPEKVHRWLDQFERKGTPGVKRVKGLHLKELPSRPRRNRKELAAV
jgi:hypothetical protein